MLNRRRLVKLLGVVGAGTLVGEQLGYLIRQPTSIIMPKEQTLWTGGRVASLDHGLAGDLYLDDARMKWYVHDGYGWAEQPTIFSMRMHESDFS